MDRELTRRQLRSLIDPELIGDLKRKPIRPMQIGRHLLHREAAWKMLVLQTVLPFVQHQVDQLDRNGHLLTDAERDIADQYASNVALFKTNWRSNPFSFPCQPDGFEKILLN